MKKRKNKILITLGTIATVTIALIVIGYLIFGESLMRKMAIGYIRPPKQATKADFPPHNIDITKYFKPVEFKYDPNIKLYRGFDDTHYIEGETNPFAIDAGEYAYRYATTRRSILCREGKIPQRFCSGSTDTDMDKCFMEAEKKYGHFMEMWDKVCKEENITNQYVKNDLGYLCKLPDEISYQFFVKEHDEKNKCVDKTLNRFQK